MKYMILSALIASGSKQRSRKERETQGPEREQGSHSFHLRLCAHDLACLSRTFPTWRGQWRAPKSGIVSCVRSCYLLSLPLSGPSQILCNFSETTNTTLVHLPCPQSPPT